MNASRGESSEPRTVVQLSEEDRQRMARLYEEVQSSWSSAGSSPRERSSSGDEESSPGDGEVAQVGPRERNRVPPGRGRRYWPCCGLMIHILSGFAVKGCPFDVIPVSRTPGARVVPSRPLRTWR